ASSWLTIEGQAFAPSTKARPAAVRRTPQQSAERRNGRAFPAVISGDPEMGPTARRTTGAAFRTSACPALCSPHFLRERKNGQGVPGAPRNPAAQRWLFDNRI